MFASNVVTNRRAIRRLAAARLVTMTGSAAANVAMAYVIYQRTGSAIWLSALYLLVFGVMGFVNPFAGALADRVDRRRLMIASELLGGLAWGALVFVRAPSLVRLLRAMHRDSLGLRDAWARVNAQRDVRPQLNGSGVDTYSVLNWGSLRSLERRMQRLARLLKG